jgi:tetrahydromethanopterin S-methyltransferase subunit F
MEATVENNVNNGQPSPAQNVRSQPKIPESIKRNQKNNKKDKEPLLTKNDKGKIVRGTKGFLIGALKFVIIVGICFVILIPLIKFFASSFFSDEDKYSLLFYLILIHPDRKSVV